MELSPDLISACLALEKYLGNANALTERELVGQASPPRHCLTPGLQTGGAQPRAGLTEAVFMGLTKLPRALGWAAV